MGVIQKSFLILMAAATVGLSGASPIYFPDDPIHVIPPPLPVTNVAVHKIDQPYDFVMNSVRWKPRPPVPAAGVNTMGVPPDSAWYTNRHGAHRMTREELQRGPTHEPPVAPFTIVGGKTEGITPGFRMEDARNRLYFVKVDPMSNPEMGTTSDVMGSRFLYALGYNVPENYIVRMQLSDLRLSDKAKITDEGGHPREMTWDDVKHIEAGIPHYSDGSFRVMASLKVEGEPVGPFYYEGLRSDDPNDLVLHEKRRDLRGLYVFFAWLNNTDARAGNTYDVIVKDGGIPHIKHYLIDFGSAFGSDGDSPKDARIGHEFMIATPPEALRSIVTMGFLPRPWERIEYSNLPAVGNFSANGFEPDEWKSDYPNPAFMSRQPEDDFWAAEQVMAFTSDDIRAIVETGEFSDPFVVEYLTNTLAERRDRIGQTFFAKVLPLDNFRVENDELRFDDLAVRHEFRPPEHYDVRWYDFDNMTGKRVPILSAFSAQLPGDVKQAAVGSFFSAVITTTKDKSKSVTVTLRKTDSGYHIVACSRTS